MKLKVTSNEIGSTDQIITSSKDDAMALACKIYTIDTHWDPNVDFIFTTIAEYHNCKVRTYVPKFEPDTGSQTFRAIVIGHDCDILSMEEQIKAFNVDFKKDDD